MELKLETDYTEYRPGMTLTDAFSNDKIPMLQMQHLRQLDFTITRRISYERTVDEFLLQLAVNDALRPLKEHSSMVILLDEQGALIEEEGRWSLLFTPNRGELVNLTDDAPMYPVLKSLFEKEEEGSVCCVDVPQRSLKTIVSGISPFCILDEYCKKQPGRYLSVAERIVFEGPEELFSHVPVCHYGRMSTVDLEEIENYHSIRALFEDYIYLYDHDDDMERQQPLSVAVFGPPGAGKSFGVKQIAKSCGRFSITSLNLSQYSSASELFEALGEALQSEKNMIPLVFFDEFDSELNGVSRGWLKYFLAPMQDGEYTRNGRINRIDGAVFVFAGATATSFEEFLPKDAEAEAKFRKVKGPDFVSRLKGILNIKGPNPTGITDRRSIIRRAMLLREQIVRKVPGICDPEGGLVNISKGLLSALLNVSEYRHGSRSLEFILAMSRLSEVNRFTPSCLPIDAQLDIHLDVKDFRSKLAFEQMMGDQVNKYAKVAHEAYRTLHRMEAVKMGLTPEQLEEVEREPEMAEWNDLDEFYKEGHRSQIRFLGEKLQAYDLNIGLRPILPGASDTIQELYGPTLELLAEMEHQRWVRDKMADGWTYGPKDSELKRSPEMVPYDELDEKTKEFIRVSVRYVPNYLNELGYELYRKSYI
ncbi:RyR domain-containing protein [[Clostridium] aminophilum]|uniref:RyR domain-containing protein n=1 Tax=[Clostridium] aminophilum TaxID=1526 RepID=UPI0033302EF3